MAAMKLDVNLHSLGGHLGVGPGVLVVPDGGLPRGKIATQTELGSNKGVVVVVSQCVHGAFVNGAFLLLLHLSFDVKAMLPGQIDGLELVLCSILMILVLVSLIGKSSMKGLHVKASHGRGESTRAGLASYLVQLLPISTLNTG